mmetsp:Transcript_19038/g.37861  ORF Transcript_19038/g.37861 Transcript_19038/m.37861 type:complete len:401 (+) Transcript_19038:282-1484(+)
MMFKVAAAFLLSSILVDADNTPNLCSDDIPNLQKIKPSDTSLNIDVIPNLTVGGEEYNGDADHFVMIPDPEAMVEKVLIYLPGTTDRPELSSCLLKSVAASTPFPTIGLSYSYLTSGDSFRNGKCQSLVAEFGLEEQINCLTEQHNDAIDGGTYGSTHFKEDKVTKFWESVDPANSITARIGKLLQYLDEKNPGTGWGGLYTAGEDPEPNWSKLIIMGHSQGAGHAAYLGQTKELMGAVMISGPQDECIECPEGTEFWIDHDYMTLNAYTAFASGDEPFYMNGVMGDNWNRMTEAGAVTWGEPTDVGFAVEAVDACASPLVTHVEYAPTSTCGGKEHCSTSLDDSVPFIKRTDGEKQYLYDLTVWPTIARPGACHKSSKGGKAGKKGTKGGKGSKAPKRS